MYEETIEIELDHYPERMTTEQVAEALKLTRESLDNHLSRGSIVIPFVKIGKAREFLKDHVRQYIELQYRAASERANQSLKQAS